MYPGFVISLGKPLNLSMPHLQNGYVKTIPRVVLRMLQYYSIDTYTWTNKAWKRQPSRWQDTILTVSSCSQFPNVLKGLCINFITWDGGKEGSFALKIQGGLKNVAHPYTEILFSFIKVKHWHSLQRGWTLNMRPRPNIAWTVQNRQIQRPSGFVVVRLGKGDREWLLVGMGFPFRVIRIFRN